MLEWSTVRLGDLATSDKGAFATGPFGSAVSSKHFRSEGVPMLRGANLSEEVGTRLDESELVFLSPELASQFARCTVRVGDLVFTCWGTVGQIGLIGISAGFSSYIVSNKQMKMTPDEQKVDPLFLYYNLSQPRMVDLVKSQAIGSSVPGFNLGQLRALPVSLPGLPVQRAIAEVLGALDNKIAANTKLANTVNSLAEAEFRRVTKAADKRTTVGQVMCLEYGKALPSTARQEGQVSVYGSGGIVGTHANALLQGPGVVVGRKGTAGAVHWSPGPFYPIDTTFYIVPKDGRVPLTYCYFALRSLRLDEMNSDSAVPGLNRAEAYACPMTLPGQDILDGFDLRVSTLFELVTQAHRESKSLASMRDELLPLLMSGKLRVRDAEKHVAEVV